MNKLLAILLLAMASLAGHAAQRQKINFNAQWLLQVGDFQQAEDPSFDDHAWQRVTLPHAFNGDEAFRKDIIHLTDTIVWYRSSSLKGHDREPTYGSTARKWASPTTA